MKTIQKKWINLSILYAILGLASGVFYREFTKWNGFTGISSLRVMHVHYIVLGALMFLLFITLEQSFGFSSQKRSGLVLALYQIGLNWTELLFLVRGICTVKAMNLSSAANAAISGIAGIGHILLAIGLVWLLFLIKKSIAKA